MAKNNTKTKILDAAEGYFSTIGFAETSMRQITSKADVNLAAINYHFGSKKDLIKSVLDRYLSQFIPDLIAQLNSSTRDQHNVKALFNCFKQPLLNLESINSKGTTRFLQLLGRGYIDFQGHLRTFITEKYQSELQQIQQAFHLVMPELPPGEIFWRLHFSLGTAAFTLAASHALTDIAEADFAQSLHTEDIIDRLLPFLAAGFANQ